MAEPGEAAAPALGTTRTRIAGAGRLALTAERSRRAELVAWASRHRVTLARLRLMAPTTVGRLLAEHVGLVSEPLPAATIGPAAPAVLATASEIDAMVAFSDPIQMLPGETTTRSLTRVAVLSDILIAANAALCAEPGRQPHREYDGGMLTLIVTMTAGATRAPSW